MSLLFGNWTRQVRQLDARSASSEALARDVVCHAP
jgi:hypothetical protein